MENDLTDEVDLLSLKVSQLLSDNTDPSQEISTHLSKRSEDDAKSQVSDKENNVSKNTNRSAKNLDLSFPDLEISGNAEGENSDVTFKGTIDIFGHSRLSQIASNMKVETVPESILQRSVKGFIKEGENAANYKEGKDKFTQTTLDASPGAVEQDDITELVKTFEKVLKNAMTTLYYFKKEIHEIGPIPRTIEGVQSQINKIKDYLVKVKTARDDCEEMIEFCEINNTDLQDTTGFKNYLVDVLRQFLYLDSKANLRYDHLNIMLKTLQSFSENLDCKIGDTDKEMRNEEDLIKTNQKNLKMNLDPLRPHAPKLNTRKTSQSCMNYYDRNVIKSWKENINQQKLLEQRKLLKKKNKEKMKEFGKELAKHTREGKINFHPCDIIVPMKEDLN